MANERTPNHRHEAMDRARAELDGRTGETDSKMEPDEEGSQE